MLSLLLFATAFAQDPNWRAPFPAHKIAGNLRYAGTADLACYLITTPKGHILINSGLADSTPLIRASVEKLGFKLEDIKILLTMQAHFDHVAALAEIQKISKAKMFATVADAGIIESGGKTDPVLLGEQYQFAPLKVARRLKDGDKVALGGTELAVILNPGHTPGSVSYSMNVTEGGRRLKVLIANMGSVVMPLVGNTKYPAIVDDLARTFEVQKKLSPDVWVAGHASHYNMAEKYKAGSFVDPEGYKQAVARFERLYHEKLAKERGR